jgi:hypothetical protein
LFSEKKACIFILYSNSYMSLILSLVNGSFSLSKNLCIHINIKTKIYFAMHLSKNHCISIYQLILWLDNKLKDIFWHRKWLDILLDKLGQTKWSSSDIIPACVYKMQTKNKWCILAVVTGFTPRICFSLFNLDLI